MAKRKLASACLFALSVMTFWGCLAPNHRKFYVGNSIEKRVSIDRAVEMYITACCKGDIGFQSTITTPSTIKYYIGIKNLGDWESRPYACCQCSTQIVRHEYPDGAIDNDVRFSPDTESAKDKTEYEFTIQLMNGRFYVSDPLSPVLCSVGDPSEYTLDEILALEKEEAARHDKENEE